MKDFVDYTNNGVETIKSILEKDNISTAGDNFNDLIQKIAYHYTPKTSTESYVPPVDLETIMTENAPSTYTSAIGILFKALNREIYGGRYAPSQSYAVYNDGVILDNLSGSTSLSGPSD